MNSILNSNSKNHSLPQFVSTNIWLVSQWLMPLSQDLYNSPLLHPFFFFLILLYQQAKNIFRKLCCFYITLEISSLKQGTP